MTPLEEWFIDQLHRYPRVALVGGSGTGKTTLSLVAQDRPVIHSDAFKHLDWSEASAEMAKRVNEHPGPLLVEGVAVARALRKGMKVDAVILLRKARRSQLKGQLSQEAGIFTVLEEWRKENLHVPIISPPKDLP